uniref:Integrase zinc-binding domain-containing protein n=1 Tax=Plectus sambesii TaxID=2011161 RepID=A0A914UWR8_9BILA
MPSFEGVEESKHKGKRSTFQHKCADFAISADGTSLMYYKMYKYNCQKKADDGSGTTAEVKKMRVVIHKGEVEQINQSVHEEIGHLMQNNTYKQVKERFYWDTMQEDICAFVTSCVKCQKNRPFKDQPVVLCPVPPPSNALSQWGMDLIKLPETEDSYNYLIIAIDHLTKWPEAQLPQVKDCCRCPHLL